jgi:hypothetical protein
MSIDRCAAWTVRVAVSLAMLGVVSLPTTIEPAWAQDRPSARPLAPEPPGCPPDDGEPVRAYDRTVPRSAEIRTVALTVLDDETSRPMADVEVRIVNYIDWRTHVFRTESRGRLRFDYPSLHGEPTLSIEARADGYVPLGCGWGFEGGPAAPEAVTLRLRRGTAMGGIVLDVADRPVEGVTVLTSVTRYGPGKRAPNPTGHESYREMPSRTGPDGRWHTDGVPPGAEEVQLRLIHPDFVSDAQTSPGGPGRSPTLAALRDRSDRQVLVEGLGLEGRVVDDEGRPIAGAEIEDMTRGLDAHESGWCHPTDAGGRFRLHLPAGKPLVLAARAEGHVPVLQVLAPVPDRPAPEFRLARGRRLRGRVVDPAGHPIEAAQVYVLTISPGKPLQFHGFTDKDGRFEWDAAPDEAAPFHIAAEGYVSNEKTWLKATPEEIAIALRPAVDIRVVAVDARTGERIPRFRIEIGRRDPETNGFRWGQPTGRTAPREFRAVLEAKDGPYHFRISADGYAPARILLPSTHTVARKTIRLEKAIR